VSPADTLSDRVTRLEAHWEDLVGRLDRQFTEMTKADARAEVLIEKMDDRLDNEAAARQELDTRFRVFVGKVVIVVLVVVGIGETLLTLLGPAIRQFLGLPQT